MNFLWGLSLPQDEAAGHNQRPTQCKSAQDLVPGEKDRAGLQAQISKSQLRDHQLFSYFFLFPTDLEGLGFVSHNTLFIF